MTNYENREIRNIAYFNPPERLKAGQIAKKIPMGNLQTFQRKIEGFEVANYKSGPKFRNGDVLVAKITPCLENGKTAFVDILDEKEVAFGSSEFIVLRAKSNADNRFLYYLAISPAFRKKAIGCMEGTSGRKRVNEGALKLYELPIPEKTTQIKIADVLSKLDSKIELNNRISAELEGMAKTLYDYWFVQFDFPDADGKPYKTSGGKMSYNTTLKREIPEGWEDGTASTLLDFNPTTSLKTGAVASYIDMDSLPVKGFMTKMPARKEFAGGVKFKNNDVAVARITPCLENGKTALISRLPKSEVGFGSTEFIILRGKKRPLPCFSACLARSESFRRFAITNMTGTSGRKRIDAKILETYSLPIPDKELLDKFESKVEPLFRKMNSNTEENDELAKLRDWLLPMLMNGQVTVKRISDEEQG